jgi:hypothetical protein
MEPIRYDEGLTRCPKVTFNRNIVESYTDFRREINTFQPEPNTKDKFDIDLSGTLTYRIGIYCPGHNMDLTKLLSARVYFYRNNEDEQPILFQTYSGCFLHDTGYLLQEVVHQTDLNCPTRHIRDAITNRSNLIQLHKYARLPFLSYHGDKLSKAGYKLRIDLEWESDYDVYTEIATESRISTDPDEINRMRYLTFEDTVKQCCIRNYEVQMGDNILPLKLSSCLGCYLIFFHFHDDVKIEGGLFQREIDRDIEVMPLNELTCQLVNGAPTTTLSKVGITTYVMDFGHNLKALGSHLATGHRVLNDSTEMIFNSSKACKLDVTIVYYNRLNYGNDSISLALNEPIEENIFNPPNFDGVLFDSESESDLESESESARVLRRSPSRWLELGDPVSETVSTVNNAVGQNPSFYVPLIEEYIMSRAPWKTTNESCIISQEMIPWGAYYYRCTTCTKVIERKALNRWFNNNKSCPHCREKYIVYPILVCNYSRFGHMLKFITKWLYFLKP